MTTWTTVFFLLFSVFLADPSFTKPLLIENSFIHKTMIPHVPLQSTWQLLFCTTYPPQPNSSHIPPFQHTNSERQTPSIPPNSKGNRRNYHGIITKALFPKKGISHPFKNKKTKKYVCVK